MSYPISYPLYSRQGLDMTWQQFYWQNVKKREKNCVRMSNYGFFRIQFEIFREFQKNSVLAETFQRTSDFYS